MKVLIASFYISILLTSSSLWACKISTDSEWNFSDEKIIKVTHDIWVGKIVSVKEQSQFGSVLYKIELEIDQSLKGKFRKGQKVVLGPFYKSTNSTVSYNKDCKLTVPFEINKQFTILKDRFHSKSITEYRGVEDPWVRVIKASN